MREGLERVASVVLAGAKPGKDPLLSQDKLPRGFILPFSLSQHPRIV